jgi:hypothetical protein
MRRIAIAMMSTISGLVLLFSYHTSRNEAETRLTDAAADVVESPAALTATTAPITKAARATNLISTRPSRTALAI